jgi:hypothetical protein
LGYLIKKIEDENYLVTTKWFLSLFISKP